MIRLENIRKVYGSHEVLRGVTLDVERGEVCVLLGPSGVGKSTLLRTINGLEPFDSGTIYVDGLKLEAGDSARNPRTIHQIRRRVGMVFQQFHLFPHLNVLQNITEAPVSVLGRSRQEAEHDAYQLLERVGLTDKALCMPTTLSGGQQQRVAIARALAMKPEALLFDEPTSALDPRTTAELVQVISDLARGGQTMLIVTHAIEFARVVAHRVHVMYGGQIIESGTPAEVLDSPKQPLTRSFLQRDLPARSV